MQLLMFIVSLVCANFSKSRIPADDSRFGAADGNLDSVFLSFTNVYKCQRPTVSKHIFTNEFLKCSQQIKSLFVSVKTYQTVTCRRNSRENVESLLSIPYQIKINIGIIV